MYVLAVVNTAAVNMGAPIWHTAFKRLLKKKKKLGIVQETETSPISPQSHKGLF